MNQVPEEKKDSVTKTLAILGFVAITILIVWLAVKVVAFIPGAFSSLASIADSLYNRNNNQELTISTPNSVVNSGETFTVSWNDLQGDGSYGFQYECADGVSVDMHRAGEVSPVECNTYVDLEQSTSVDVTVNARERRFTDLKYSVAYDQTATPRVTTDAVITVVNTTIPTGVTVNTDEVKTPTQQPGTNTGTERKPLPSTGLYDEPETTEESTPVKPQTHQIPQSTPKGQVDLAVTLIGFGTVSNSGTFTPHSGLETGDEGAVQFEIKNIGTKTATSWSYTVELPDGLDYQSDAQADLKPNERVVITLGFVGFESGTATIEVAVDAKGDTKTSNNSDALRVEID